MTRSIAVGYDGSAGADAAVRWAVSEAVATGAGVTVVHAVGMLERAGLAAAGVPSVREDSVRRLAAEGGLDPGRLAWREVDGDPCSALLRSATEADLLVVGTRGAGAHRGSLLGSTSLKLVEHASVPVVVVPLPAT